ncbi:FAD-dependent oxidoreductase [Chitinophaga oryzae]|uniref:FAD-dependent oxidoreductase n=1 Tax=Chitinophaga oryzae TaxID=2725414 RepID=A0ABX6LJX2_9BACT|nr:FAD-dependent oxidoreductase [Chitinophaga oryzae]QJB40440.1 FAD-dependent oxidoreductase [Chitinophaga oryzae]
MIAIRRILISQLLCFFTWQLSAQSLQTDLLIIGGGASGTTAGIQAARMGVKVTILEETAWLGGMLTAAGVSAIDGNHALPSGLWGEFREKLHQHYGGPRAVATGWVSNTLFEPTVGNRILQTLAAREKQLQILFNTSWTSIQKVNGRWQVNFIRNKRRGTIEAPLIIDATELGDIMAATRTGYRTGMDSRLETGEAVAPLKANDYIQVLTYVATLKDYGAGADKTIARPAGYDPALFRCCCANDDPYSGNGGSKMNCDHMMQYGKLPNHKYMINWPGCGNDYPLNVIEMTRDARAKALQQAKMHTLRYVYYLQTELGYKHLGLADDEYPTADKLPMIPYYREARRLKGVATLSFNHLAHPFDQPEAYYRTGIAVGDYPIDHHQEKDPAVPKIDFSKAKVPSYNIPLGSLIPDTTDGLIVAEKSISVTNIVNGATRLQPVVLQVGQAAGALAAISLQQKIQPRQVAVRQVQQALLKAGVYLMPYIDVPKEHPHFDAIQRIGATGILRGIGIPYTWANQTWFYPQRPISEYEFIQGLLSYYPAARKLAPTGQDLTPAFLVKALQAAGATVTNDQLATAWQQLQFSNDLRNDLPLNREMAAVLTDHFLHPFDIPVSFTGAIQP